MGVGSNPTPDRNEFFILTLFAYLSPRRLKFSSKEDGFLQGVDCVKFSIAAFQAVDLGSIPGRRSIFFHVAIIELTDITFD